MDTKLNPVRSLAHDFVASPKDLGEATSNGTKKRVLFIVTQSEMGGAQRFVLEIVSHVDKEKYELLVAVGSDGGG